MTLSRKKIDEYFMRRALSLALRGMERTSPNPLVGCVVERDGVVLAEGWHACCGEAHAERAALEGLDSAAGATIYVNLEPCSHFGRTPPCAPLIVEKGIRRAVVGMIDPDERAAAPDALGRTALKRGADEWLAFGGSNLGQRFSEAA